MVQSQDLYRPYAASSNVLAVIQRGRTRNLPETINNEFLRISGVPETVFGRVTQALRFLNLVSEDDRPTDKFQALAAATETQYRELLDKIVREAYRTELSMVDPGKDPQGKIMDAFRQYQPRSQTIRMVMLFYALCREAGIPLLDAPRQRQMKASENKTKGGSRAPNQPPSKSQHEQPRKATTFGQPQTIFGITEDDICVLTEEEFDSVWSALGTVARARAIGRKQVTEVATKSENAREQPDKN